MKIYIHTGDDSYAIVEKDIDSVGFERGKITLFFGKDKLTFERDEATMVFATIAEYLS